MGGIKTLEYPKEKIYLFQQTHIGVVKLRAGVKEDSALTNEQFRLWGEGKAGRLFICLILKRIF